MRFLALYDGKTVSSAELLAVTADERILRDFGRCLMGDEIEEREPPRRSSRQKKSNTIVAK